MALLIREKEELPVGVCRHADDLTLLTSIKRFSSWTKDMALGRREYLWLLFGWAIAELNFLCVLRLSNYGLEFESRTLTYGALLSLFYSLTIKGLDGYRKEKRLDPSRLMRILGLGFFWGVLPSVFVLGPIRGPVYMTLTSSSVFVCFWLFISFLENNPKRFLIMGIPTQTSRAIDRYFFTNVRDPLHKFYRHLGRVTDERYPSTIVVTRTGVGANDSMEYLKRALQSGINIVDEKEFYMELFGCFPVFGTRQDCDVIVGLHARLPFSETAMRMFDLVLAGIALVLLSPVLLFLAFVIKIDSRGPVFFIQKRLGRGNVPFNIFKFRTMQMTLDTSFTTVKDPRVTRVGRLLRHFHLDELPQLLNVLRGHMSLVGPRPEALHFAERMKNKIPAYDLRYSVRPGITGWAQLVQGYAMDDLNATLEKLSFDFYYLKNRSVWMDLSLLLRTAFFIWNDTSYKNRSREVGVKEKLKLKLTE